MSLDAATVRRIARLARLHVPEHDIDRLQAELSGILGWIEQLNEVDVTDIHPVVGNATMALRLRADDVTTDLTGGGKPAEILANAPGRAGNFFTVPKVVE
jgi:aspartyl-tRNA(Asn)/glutamyl-tRNA(Gln) amidotransferase subunit C